MDEQLFLTFMPLPNSFYISPEYIFMNNPSFLFKG